MKCPNCGAEASGKFCEYCGSELSSRKEDGKPKCSKCGSSNVSFKRENQGEIRGKNAKRVVHRTVGVCNDCGNTWYIAEEKPKKRKTWLWALGWLCIFPLPLTILLLRKKNMNAVLKYLIIGVAWLFYLFIGLAGNTTDGSVTPAETTAPTEAATPAETVAPTEEVVPPEEITPVSQIEEAPQVQDTKAFYSDAKVVDLMNGAGTAKIGTITVAKASQADCTDEALAGWYFNYVKNHADSNYHVIIYTDVNGKGVYANKGFIQKDIALMEEKNGTYMLGDDAGSTYYSVSDEEQTITVQFVMADEEVVNQAKQ